MVLFYEQLVLMRESKVLMACIGSAIGAKYSIEVLNVELYYSPCHNGMGILLLPVSDTTREDRGKIWQKI